MRRDGCDFAGAGTLHRALRLREPAGSREALCALRLVLAQSRTPGNFLLGMCAKTGPQRQRLYLSLLTVSPRVPVAPSPRAKVFAITQKKKKKKVRSIHFRSDRCISSIFIRIYLRFSSIDSAILFRFLGIRGRLSLRMNFAVDKFFVSFFLLYIVYFL